MSYFDQFRLHVCCSISHAWKALSALWCSRAREFTLWIIAILFAASLLSGCALRRARAEIKQAGLLAGGQAIAPKDNGTPATVASSGEETRMEIPAGSTVTETTIAAQPALPATETTPAQPAVPITIVREVHLAAPSAIVQKTQSVQTSTGTIDTAVAMHRIETESRRPLLYCAIVAVVAGLGFMYVRFQSIAVMCFISAGAFFLAWKMSEISPWVGGLFLVAAVAGFAFYKRAEWDKDGDGIPDALQKKPPVS